MAKVEEIKKPEEKDKKEDWTPDQPLADADDEAEVQRRHRAQRRLKYLDEQVDKDDKKPKKVASGERRSIW